MISATGMDCVSNSETCTFVSGPSDGSAACAGLADGLIS